MPWLRNKTTGERVFVPDQAASPQGTPIGMQDPARGYEAPQAAANVNKTNADIANNAGRLQLDRDALGIRQQELAIKQAAALDARRAAGNAAAINSRDRQQRVGNLNALAKQIARVRQLYAEGPGSTRGIMGAQDYLPTPGNRAFDSAGASLSEIGLAAFRVPGIGSQSDAELKAFVQANRPSASDYDAQINEKLRNLETRLTEAYKPYGVDYRGAAARGDARKGIKGAPRKPSGAGWKVERID